MAFIDDTGLDPSKCSIEIIRPVGRREITHAIHDIDGTYSLIRDWPPVMSIAIHWAMTCGLREDFDSDFNVRRLTELSGTKPLPETDRFCLESAGLSAITQMEYGIRRAVETGAIPPESGVRLTESGAEVNSRIIKRIWNGEERFDDMNEPEALTAFIAERTPRLFRLYEKILNGACRDKNTAEAWKDPEKWRVPGAMEFMSHLFNVGIRNYFVTGAVIYEEGGMYEEVKSLGFDIGPGRMVEAVKGSSWDRKMPKEEVIRGLVEKLSVSPDRVLVVGDGRTEIKAGVDMGGVTISRLPKEALRQRELQIGFGTNYIFRDYTDPVIPRMIRK